MTRFFAIEIDAYRAGAASPGGDAVWAGLEWAADPGAGTGAEDTQVVRASDMGYRTRAADAGGVVTYPATVASAFALNRSVPLPPASPTAWAAASVTLANLGRIYDNIGRTTNVDGRSVKVLTGQKAWDGSRGYDVDPSYAALGLAFAGIGMPWNLSEDALEIPVRDASYWLERPLQQNVYAGTGGREGTPSLKGVVKPMARGGGGGHGEPIRNITPRLIDPVNRIYHCSDGPGWVNAVYEGGDPQILGHSSVPDLYVGVTPAGYYRLETSSTGLFFQLGSKPVRQITCDVQGYFPVAGDLWNVMDIALYLMIEHMAVPLSMLDWASFNAVRDACGYPRGGWHWDEPVSGVQAVERLVSSVGAKIVPLRDGRLRCVLLAAIAPGTAPTATLTSVEILNMRPVPLGLPLEPPPYRWKVGYNHNFTVQRSDLDPDVTEQRRQFLADEDSFATWASTAVLSAYRRPNDPAPFPTALSHEYFAQALADRLGALWGVMPPRRVYDVDVPLDIGLPIELGDVVLLRYPIAELDAGALGRVVGEALRAGDSMTTLRVLV